MVNVSEGVKIGGLEEYVRQGFNEPFDTNHKDELGLCGYIVGAFLLAEAGEADLFTLCITVFLDVSFCALEDHATLFFLSLFGGKG